MPQRDVAPAACGITVFGSSEPGEGDPLYRTARELGRLVARGGRAVVTGGYGGVMEAASRGAREAGGTAIGVTCRVFEARRPNPWVTRVLVTADLHERNRELIRLGAGFVVLDGRAGTLAELALLWALDRAGCLEQRPVVLLGRGVASLPEHLERMGMLDRAQAGLGQVAGSPEEAVRLLDRKPGSPA